MDRSQEFHEKGFVPAQTVFLRIAYKPLGESCRQCVDNTFGRFQLELKTVTYSDFAQKVVFIECHLHLLGGVAYQLRLQKVLPDCCEAWRNPVLEEFIFRKSDGKESAIRGYSEITYYRTDGTYKGIVFFHFVFLHVHACTDLSLCTEDGQIEQLLVRIVFAYGYETVLVRRLLLFFGSYIVFKEHHVVKGDAVS